MRVRTKFMSAAVRLFGREQETWLRITRRDFTSE